MAAWRIVEEDGRLRIEHPTRAPLTVDVEGWRFVLRSAGREIGRFSFLDVRAVGRCASEALRRGRRASPYDASLAGHDVPHPLVIAGRLLADRQRLLAAMEPEVRAVWERVAPFTCVPPQLLCAEALYRDPWIVRDVLQYPAAAVALAFIETALRPAALLWEPTTAAGEAALLEALRHWRDLFSPTGRAYRSLNRTLMRLPEGVASALLCRLRDGVLPRPVTNRLELTAVLLAREVYARCERPEVAQTHLHVLERACEAEIAAAVERVGAAVGGTGQPPDRQALETTLRLLADYPEPAPGRLAALVERALRWHQTDPDVRGEVRALGGESMPTRRPPIALPDVAGVTFLASAGAVVAEGRRMHHCVATYARRAVTGICYLFHVSHAGSEATIEVDRHGAVVQACGPANQRNAATQWGRRQLRTWGFGLLPSAARRRRQWRSERRRRAHAGRVPETAVQLELLQR